MALSGRNRLLSAIHAAKRRLGLDDDTYRDMLERLTGERSAKALNEKDLHEVLSHLNGAGAKGFYAGRPVRAAGGPNAPLVRKIRALWLSLYHLGAVEDARESALLAFVERQTGKQAMEFLKPAEHNLVIEALKAWAAREGVVWDERGDAQASVARAIWNRLAEEGAVRIDDPGALDAWAVRVLRHPHRCGFGQLPPAAQNRAIAELGRWLKRVRRERAP